MAYFTVNRGDGLTANYTTSNFGDAVDWTGTATLYRSYPDEASLTKALTYITTALQLELTSVDLVSLALGQYTLVTTQTSVSLGVSVPRTDFVVMAPALSASGDFTYCDITMTLLKADGTPAGAESNKSYTTIEGVKLYYGWNGVSVTAKPATVLKDGTVLVDVETLTTKTDGAGYASFRVVQGSIVTVTCPALSPTSVVVDTTGETAIDISSYF